MAAIGLSDNVVDEHQRQAVIALALPGVVSPAAKQLTAFVRANGA